MTSNATVTCTAKSVSLKLCHGLPGTGYIALRSASTELPGMDNVTYDEVEQMWKTFLYFKTRMSLAENVRDKLFSDNFCLYMPQSSIVDRFVIGARCVGKENRLQVSVLTCCGSNNRTACIKTRHYALFVGVSWSCQDTVAAGSVVDRSPLQLRWSVTRFRTLFGTHR